MVYSFNASRLATVWGGFSTKWYGQLLHDRQLLDAAWVSLKVAFWTACASTVLGTMAAMAMVRMRRFPGKTLFGALITAPLVMPEVIIGLSILLLLVSMGGVLGTAPRGAVAIWMAHVTFTVLFVTVVISSRLQELDRSLEEAAMDLGATPLKVFFSDHLADHRAGPGIGLAAGLYVVAGRCGDRQFPGRAQFHHLADQGVLVGAPGHQPEDQRPGHGDGAGGVGGCGDRLVVAGAQQKNVACAMRNWRNKRLPERTPALTWPMHPTNRRPERRSA